MTKIINLTQHAATPDQIAAGVVDLTGVTLSGERQLDKLKALLTFSELPSLELIRERAEAVLNLAAMSGNGRAGRYAVMIGGAPYLMAALERVAAERGVQCGYAFSERVSVEEPQPDGTVLKKNVFKHAGFVWV